MKQKKMRWVAWFSHPLRFATKKEMETFCKGTIVRMGKISQY